MRSLHENLIKHKVWGSFFGTPVPLFTILGPKKASQNITINKRFAMRLKKQAGTQRELKRAYNSLSKSRFSENWKFMKIHLKNAYNSLSKSSLSRFTVYSEKALKRAVIPCRNWCFLGTWNYGKTI